MKENTKCDYCERKIYKEPYRLKANKNNFCSKECHDKFRHNKRLDEMSMKVGMDFKEWLINKYVNDKMTTRQIAELLYGNSKNQSSINKWLRKFDIPLRRGSEAIKTQWINNDERRKKQANIIKSNITKDVREKIIKKMQTGDYKQKQRINKLGERNGMYRVLGVKHPNWNPNRTREQRILERKTFEYSQWRKNVFEKDCYTCQVCGDDSGGNLVAHHLESYDINVKYRYDIKNGVTLCEKCHKDFHGKYGYGNNTKKQFEEYLKS